MNGCSTSRKAPAPRVRAVSISDRSIAGMARLSPRSPRKASSASGQPASRWKNKNGRNLRRFVFGAEIGGCRNAIGDPVQTVDRLDERNGERGRGLARDRPAVVGKPLERFEIAGEARKDRGGLRVGGEAGREPVAGGIEIARERRTAEPRGRAQGERRDLLLR